LQTYNDDLYHLDITSDKYYSNTHPHNSRDENSQDHTKAVQLEPQPTTYTSDDQIEVEQQESQPSQSLATPLHNVPMDQLLLEFESVSKPQVNTETQLKILPHRTTRGKPRVDYEPLLTFKPYYTMNNFMSYHRLSKEMKLL
jgi:hypothetical protein